MQMQPPDLDTLFAELLQDLPAETVTMAREFKAFVRTKKFKTPPQLERVVFLFSGVEKSHRWWLSRGSWFPAPLFSQRCAEEGHAYGESPLTAYKHTLINRCGYATPSLSMHTVRGREAWEEARRV